MDKQHSAGTSVFPTQGAYADGQTPNFEKAEVRWLKLYSITNNIDDFFANKQVQF